jgi:hypothetical protein
VTGALAARLGAALDRPLDPAVAEFARELGQATGARAVLFYGSNLRTGSLEGVLDFYVLLPGARETGLWPRVSYRERPYHGHDGDIVLRAKIATMALATFADATRGETIDTTIWARFVQPSALAWAADDAAADEITAALASAACTAARLAVAVGPERGHEEDYWRALFRATYRAELRFEQPGREDTIIAANRGHFAGLLPLALVAAGIPFGQDGGTLTPRLERAERKRILAWWRKRRRLGKPLNLVRLARASATFDGAARYAAWKIERHTGVAIPLTPWRERHPLLAAPGMAWRYWRDSRRRSA